MRPPLKQTLYWLILTLILYISAYKWLDIPLMYFISNAYQDTFLVSASKIIKFIFIPEAWFVLGLLCLAAAVYHHRSKRFKYLSYALPFGINLVFAFILAFILKFILGRYRPMALLNNNFYGFQYFSFGKPIDGSPSGHTVMAFTFFYTLARFFKKTWITLLCMIPPLLIAFSRLVLAEHYLSDVLLGAYIGLISVYWGEWIRQTIFASCVPKSH